MPHLSFLLYLVSLCAAAASITVSLLLHARYRRRAILYYALMLCVVALIVSGHMGTLYLDITGMSSSDTLQALMLALRKAGFALGVFAGPLFCHQLIGKPLTRAHRIVYAALGVAYLATAAAELAAAGSRLADMLRLWVGLPILFGLFAWCVLQGALALGTLGSKTLNLALKVFFAGALMVFPASLVQYATQRSLLPHFLENPLAYLVLNTLGIVFALRYFDHPPYLEAGELSGHFRERFRITPREEEIVLALAEGLSNSAISERLCISPRTVESHLYNVFQKTGVKNRTQLANLLNTNRGG